MIEKRFINDIDNGKLIDTKGELSTIHYSDAIDFYELCEFLNKLNDENDQLKFFVEYEKRQHKHWKRECFENIEEIAQLKREIVQLKGDVE